MIALTIILVALAMVGAGISFRRFGNKVLDEILAAELRQIDRERKAKEYEANLTAKWMN